MSLVDSDAVLVGRRAFTDPEVFALELERIYRKSWLFLAHESEIAEPGDYVTRRMGNDSVIVTRDEHGKPRVFLNTCLHRGAQLCSTDLGNTSHFRCSYHGWTYSNSGQLRGVPEMKEVYGSDFDKTCFRLVEPAKVDVFSGLIFACWDEEAVELDEYLGDMGFYLRCMLEKTDQPLRVMGPPSRAIVDMNWKIGAENYGGDGYHLATTHQSTFDLGVVGDPRSLEEWGKPMHKSPAHTVLGGNGHTVRIQQWPFEFEEPRFPGYPEELWPEFERNLDPKQIEVMSGLVVMHGTVFPNLSFIDVTQEMKGSGDTPPTAYMHLRQWQPISESKTELILWGLVPPNAPQDWVEHSRKTLTRTIGFSGIFETDDFQNWISLSSASSGMVARNETFNYQGGQHLEVATDVDWPGEVYSVDHNENNQRHMYGRWAELMEGVAVA
jgi:PAH dioxygenase large subunit